MRACTLQPQQSRATILYLQTINVHSKGINPLMRYSIYCPNIRLVANDGPCALFCVLRLFNPATTPLPLKLVELSQKYHAKFLSSFLPLKLRFLRGGFHRLRVTLLVCFRKILYEPSKFSLARTY